MTPQPRTPPLKLSVWDQIAPPHYSSLALCFRVPELNRFSILKHVGNALTRLTTKRPDFGRQLIADTSHMPLVLSSSKEPLGSIPTDHPLLVRTPRNPVIPLDTFPNEFEFPFTFDQLEKQGFPVDAFINPAFMLKDDDPLDGPKHVARIRLLYLDGGIVMFVYVHHSYGDGSCMAEFLHCLSCELAYEPRSYGALNRVPDVDFDLDTGKEGDLDFKELLVKCPEYTLPSHAQLSPTGVHLPSINLDMAAYKKTLTGKVFIIPPSKLEPFVAWLNELYPGRPISHFLAMRALIWAHTTKARLATQHTTAALFTNHEPRFCNPHNWHGPGKDLFPENSSLKTYFGNSIAQACVSLPNPQILIDACGWKTAKDTNNAPSSLLQIIQGIDNANRSIDRDFIITRTALFEAAGPDIRRIGLVGDPRAPHTFSANTWKFIGRGLQFWFPGTGSLESVEPSAIARCQPEWALPHAIILPDASGEDYSMLVTLEKEALEVLERDEAWMSLVGGKDVAKL